MKMITLQTLRFLPPHFPLRGGSPTPVRAGALTPPWFVGGSAPKPPATQASTFNLSATLPLRPPIASPAMQAPANEK